MANFSEISNSYENESVIQKSASEILFELLDIQPNDNVLDLGCGTGHISKMIRDKTIGHVVGVDPSKGMIEKAQEKFAKHSISFHVCSAEQLDFNNEFDIIFCNSAFQWFVDPSKAIIACFNSLKTNGKIAIQAPAKDNYCPNFLTAIDEVKNHKATGNIFRSFSQPWFFCNTSKEYLEIFKKAGFTVENSTIDEVITYQTAEEAYKIFESGAAAGYLNQDYYSTQLSEEYIEDFRKIIRGSFENQAAEINQVRMIFNRIYLLARK